MSKEQLIAIMASQIYAAIVGPSGADTEEKDLAVRGSCIQAAYKILRDVQNGVGRIDQ